MDIRSLSVKELSEHLAAGKLKSVDITRAYLDAIEADNASEKPLNAYVKVFKEEALKQAEEADKRRAAGQATALTGVPLAVKDNMNIEGFPTTCSSKILEGFNATDDATVVGRLVRREGMVVLGKTNMDEFAMGSSTETSHAGITRNPFDRDRIPGGSSGGSAAAVGGKLAPIALGSDTGGSIRQPAALCGAVGLKPTYGTVSRYGLIAFASSLDQIGPIARTVEDAAMLQTAMEGHDPKDSTSLEMEGRKFDLTRGLKGLKIGLPKEYFGKGLDPEIEANLRETVKKMEAAGATVVEISLPHSEYAVPTYYIVATAEASSNLERYDGIKYGFRAEGKGLQEIYRSSRSQGFGDEVKRRILLGTYVLSAGYYDAYYLKALKVRSLIRSDFDKAFEKVDFIIGPTSPTPAFKIGEKTDDPIAMYLSDIYTISVNLAGNPGISVPTGTTKSGLPIGTQIIGKLLDENGLLSVSKAVEELWAN